MTNDKQMPVDAKPCESKSPKTPTVRGADTSRRWPAALVACAAFYYGISALTLPFVDKVWFGELPPLAIIQLPKEMLKTAVQDGLMSAMHVLGLSHGSFSPDYRATHGWAMGIMTITPALLLLAVLGCLKGSRNRRKMMAVILICATIDAVVTLWFDRTSGLKLL